MRLKTTLASLALAAGLCAALTPALAQYAGIAENGGGLNLRKKGGGGGGSHGGGGSGGGGQSTPSAFEGRRVFMKLNCYGCHGIRGRGGMGPNLVGEGEIEAVTHGEDGGMPAFRSWLAGNDLNNLKAYLQSLGRTNEPTFTHWWEPSPTR